MANWADRLAKLAQALTTGGAVPDATISTTDITTNNVSTSKHGFAPKAPNDATKFLDGTGAFSTPAGGGSGSFLSSAKWGTD